MEREAHSILCVALKLLEILCVTMNFSNLPCLILSAWGLHYQFSRDKARMPNYDSTLPFVFVLSSLVRARTSYRYLRTECT